MGRWSVSPSGVKHSTLEPFWILALIHLGGIREGVSVTKCHTVGLLREICANFLRVPLQISLSDGNAQVERSGAIKGALADLYVLAWMGCSSWRGSRQRSVKVKGTLGRSLLS